LIASTKACIPFHLNIHIPIVTDPSPFQSSKAPSAPAAATPIIFPTPVSIAPFFVTEATLLEDLLALELALFDALAALFDALVLAALTAVLLTDAALVGLAEALVEGELPVAVTLASLAVAIFKMPLWTLSANDLMSLGNPAYQLLVDILERSPLRKDCCHFVLTAVAATLEKEAYWGSAVTWARNELTFEAAGPLREAPSPLWAAAVAARIATRV